VKIISILLGVLLAVPAAFGAAATHGSEAAPAGVFVPGRFLSVAGSPDGSAYLLATDHRVVRVKADGSQEAIALPRISESKQGDRFCDLSADGKTLSFCGFPFPVVFVLSLKDTTKFEIARPSDQEATSLHLLNISRSGEGWRLRDADGVVLEMQNGKPLRRLPAHAALEAGARGSAIVLPPPGAGKGAIQPGRVQKEDGSLIWVAPTPEAPRRVMSVEYLGIDPDQRLIFNVMTGSGELDSVWTLYAVRGGKTVASRVIPGPGRLTLQRPCRLAPDGTILLVQAAAEGKEGVILERIRLSNKD